MFRDDFKQAHCTEVNQDDPVRRLALQKALELLETAGVDLSEGSKNGLGFVMGRVGTRAMLLRSLAGESIKNVSDRTNNQISNQYLGRVEKLEVYPSIAKILVLARTFEVPVSYMFGELGTMPNPQTAVETFGKKISELTKGESLVNVGRKTGIPFTYIAQIKNGVNTSEGTIRKFIVGYATPPSFFFDEPKIG